MWYEIVKYDSIGDVYVRLASNETDFISLHKELDQYKLIIKDDFIFDDLGFNEETLNMTIPIFIKATNDG